MSLEEIAELRGNRWDAFINLASLFNNSFPLLGGITASNKAMQGQMNITLQTILDAAKLINKIKP